MSAPFIGEIRIVAFNFAPRGWAFCNGQLLAINQNQALFSILGTTYGGNGTTNFALPNLQSRFPVHYGNGTVLGQRAGEENHTLTLAELGAHPHGAVASSNAADQTTPGGNYWANGAQTSYTHTPGTSMALSSSVGGGQPHVNLAPYLTLNVVIALVGVFPSRN